MASVASFETQITVSGRWPMPQIELGRGYHGSTTRMLLTVNRSFVAGLAVASKPDITQAWAPRHISSPTGRRVSASARAAVAIASPRVRTETTTYGPSPSSFSAPAEPSGSDPGPTSRSLESVRAAGQAGAAKGCVGRAPCLRQVGHRLDRRWYAPIGAAWRDEVALLIEVDLDGDGAPRPRPEPPRDRQDERQTTIRYATPSVSVACGGAKGEAPLSYPPPARGPVEMISRLVVGETSVCQRSPCLERIAWRIAAARPRRRAARPNPRECGEHRAVGPRTAPSHPRRRTPAGRA